MATISHFDLQIWFTFKQISFVKPPSFCSLHITWDSVWIPLLIHDKHSFTIPSMSENLFSISRIQTCRDSQGSGDCHEKHLVGFLSGNSKLQCCTRSGVCSQALGITGEKSHKVLFVAIARTLGIPARLNPADGAIEYWDGMRFVAVLEESRKESHLTVFAGEKGDWNYFQNWTIAVTDGRGYLTLDFSDRKWEAGKLELDIMPGDYRILTGNRLPNGNILGKRYDFHIEKDETKRVELELREYSLKEMFNRHSIPDSKLTDRAGNQVLVSELTGRRRGELSDAEHIDVPCKADEGLDAAVAFGDAAKRENSLVARNILFWLEEGREPTEHILNEMMDLKEKYEKIQKQVIFILRSKDSLKNATMVKCLELFPEIQVYFHDFGKDKEMTARRMYVDSEKLPLMVITEGPCQGIFAAAGYSVGMADMLMRIFEA